MYNLAYSSYFVELAQLEKEMPICHSVRKTAQENLLPVVLEIMSLQPKVL